MVKCWLSCNYVAYEEENEDGSYTHGLKCKRCGDKRPVSHVSKKGAEIQAELTEIGKVGYANHPGGYQRYLELQETFRREVTRL